MGGTVAVQSGTLKATVDNIISEEQLSAGRLTSRVGFRDDIWQTANSSEMDFEDEYFSFEGGVTELPCFDVRHLWWLEVFPRSEHADIYNRTKKPDPTMMPFNNDVHVVLICKSKYVSRNNAAQIMISFLST